MNGNTTEKRPVTHSFFQTERAGERESKKEAKGETNSVF